jgi:hypothetical protein
MIGFKKACVAAGLLAIIGLVAASASGTGLLGTGYSYYYNSRHWEGANTFSKVVNDGTLQGTIDWAVFTAANYEAAFPDSTYTPTPSELVYSYQIFDNSYAENPNAVQISKAESPLLSGAPADNAGDFTSADLLSGVAPDSATIQSADVIWTFGANGGNNIEPSQNSVGLTYCSPNNPSADFYVVINGGTGVDISGVASPGTISIPEPSTLAMLVLAAASLGAIAFRNWRRK